MELSLTAGFQQLLGVRHKSDGSDPVSSKWIYRWFMSWTLLGAEYGYLTVLPMWYWNGDAHVMRKALFVTVVSMYIGQWIKSYTPWPRPSSPPVVRLEHIYVAESTMPSTHACLGSALPFSILFFTLQIYDISVEWGIFIATFSAVNICLSRVYLGMHFPSDIFAGCVISISTLYFLHPYVLLVDVFFLNYLPLAFVAAIFLCVIFPAPSSNENGLRADTCRLVGVLLATFIIEKFYVDIGLMKLPCPHSHHLIPLPADAWSLNRLLLGMLRFGIGLPIGLLARTISRKVMHFILTHVISHFPAGYRPPEGISIKRWGPYEIPFYLVSYAMIALSITSSIYFYILFGITSPGYLQDYYSVVKFDPEHILDFKCVHTA